MSLVPTPATELSPSTASTSGSPSSGPSAQLGSITGSDGRKRWFLAARTSAASVVTTAPPATRAARAPRDPAQHIESTNLCPICEDSGCIAYDQSVAAPQTAVGEGPWALAGRWPESPQLLGIAAVAVHQLGGAGVDARVQVAPALGELGLDLHEGRLDLAQALGVVPGDLRVPRGRQAGQPAVLDTTDELDEAGRAPRRADSARVRPSSRGGGGELLDAGLIAGERCLRQVEAPLHQATPVAHLAFLLAQGLAQRAQSGERFQPQPLHKTLVGHDPSFRQADAFLLFVVGKRTCALERFVD